MAEVRLSPIAQADFDEILDHLVVVAGNQVAAGYAEKLQLSRTGLRHKRTHRLELPFASNRFRLAALSRWRCGGKRRVVASFSQSGRNWPTYGFATSLQIRP